jgi:anti-sigma regulatory factor (Ser/Thr protein kinase)
LLDISKLDAGALEPRRSDFRVDDILATLGVEFGIIARERGIEFRAVPCRVTVHSDRQFLRRILQNFLSNALRYTRQGKVLLGCRRRGDTLVIEVLDTGPGIPRSISRRTSTRSSAAFSRATNWAPRAWGSGLAIVQRMARALGHEIRVRSELGRGSVFSVEVPIARTQAAVAGPPAACRVRRRASTRRACCASTTSTTSSRAWRGCWRAGPAPCSRRPTRGAQWPRSRRPVARPTSCWPISTSTAATPGLKTIEAVRARWGDVPAVIITADYGEQARERVRNAGFAIMRKPVKPAALRAIMSQLLLARRQNAIDAARVLADSA